MRDGVEKSMGDVFQPDRRNGKGSQNNGAGCSREIELALVNL